MDFSSARSAVLSMMLADDQFDHANGRLGTVRESLWLVAPLAGAALYAGFGGRAVAVLDAPTALLPAPARPAGAARNGGPPR